MAEKPFDGTTTNIQMVKCIDVVDVMEHDPKDSQHIPFQENQ
jgi:hypothetical protein